MAHIYKNGYAFHYRGYIFLVRKANLGLFVSILMITTLYICTAADLTAVFTHPRSVHWVIAVAYFSPFGALRLLGVFIGARVGVTATGRASCFHPGGPSLFVLETFALVGPGCTGTFPLDAVFCLVVVTVG